MSDTGGLCGTCYRDTQFIGGLACDKCGVPLPGESDGTPEICDDCMTIARPWDHGRAAVVYSGVGRRLVLGLKHGDRTEIAPTAGLWMYRTAKDLINSETIIAPIPLHWTRFYKRRYNQSALLAEAIADLSSRPVIPDLLKRPKRTRSLDGMTKDQRFTHLDRAVQVTPRFRDRIKGADILLVDDVMTSGATFAAASEACYAAGASSVCVVALARVAKDA